MYMRIDKKIKFFKSALSAQKFPFHAERTSLNFYQKIYIKITSV